MSVGGVRRARRREESLPWGGQRLQRVLGIRPTANGPLAALHDLPPTDDAGGSPFPTLAYIDATLAPGMWHSPGDVALHVLWTAPGVRPVLSVENDTGEPIDFPCAPGDFLGVPPGRSFGIGAGILAAMVGSAQVMAGPAETPASGSLRGPTHGLPVFSRFNRQTFGVATPALALCRWKLTQPQAITAPTDRLLWLSNLVEPVAVSWAGGLDLLGRTEGCFVAPGTEVTVTPNDLGYVLVAWVPELETEVVAPLRSAGYTRAEMAALGMVSFGLDPA